MIAIKRRVCRLVPRAGGALVVTLMPGAVPMIEVREKFRRSGYTISLAALYVILAQRAVDNRLALRTRHRRRA